MNDLRRILQNICNKNDNDKSRLIDVVNEVQKQKGHVSDEAIDIIANGLKASLDIDAGGKLAEQLSALYDYMVRRLLSANLENNSAALDEVLRLLGEIHSAWTEIGTEG